MPRLIDFKVSIALFVLLVVLMFSGFEWAKGIVHLFIGGGNPWYKQPSLYALAAAVWLLSRRGKPILLFLLVVIWFANYVMAMLFWDGKPLYLFGWIPTCYFSTVMLLDEYRLSFH